MQQSGFVRPKRVGPGTSCGQSWAALSVLISAAAAMLLLVSIITPCWTSRSYLEFNSSAGIKDAPDITVCFGLQSYQASYKNTPSPTVQTEYVSEMTDAVLNLSTFKRNGDTVLPVMAVATALSMIGLVTQAFVAASGSKVAFRALSVSSALAHASAAIFALVGFIVWFAKAPAARDWALDGSGDRHPSSGNKPYLSHYFDNAPYSSILAFVGMFLALVVACTTRCMSASAPAVPAGEGNDDAPLLNAGANAGAGTAYVPSAYGTGPSGYVAGSH